MKFSGGPNGISNCRNYVKASYGYKKQCGQVAALQLIWVENIGKFIEADLIKPAYSVHNNLFSSLFPTGVFQAIFLDRL